MGKKIFTDQLDRSIEIADPPGRIISLVPSQTELLFSLGLSDEIVGITKFCIHPKEKFAQKPKIGGTKKLDIDAIRILKPDLIIGNKEENERGQVELLMHEFPVWMSDINTLEDALEMIAKIGEVCGKNEAAQHILHNVITGFKNIPVTTDTAPKLKIAYFIWKDPYMVAGQHTFINDMIGHAGWANAFEDSRYPEISIEKLQKAKPDVILLSSEPYPFKAKHIEEYQSICPAATVKIIDGELFSWYGSRLEHTPEYLYSLKHQFDTFKLK